MPDVSLYKADDVIDKTLFAQEKIPVYDNVPPQPQKLLGYVEPGNPVGIVYSYLEADPSRGRANLWWMFYPTDGSEFNNYYAEQVGGYYDVEALRQQGVISEEEARQKEEEANKPWYEQLLDNYGKPLVIGILITAVAAAAVKGFFSRPKQTS